MARQLSNFPTPPAMTASVGHVFGLEEAASDRQSVVRGAADAKAILEKNRVRALRSLREQLFRVYRKDAETWRTLEWSKLSEMDEKDQDEVFEKIGALLQRVAPERGRLLIELTARIGFPIRPPSLWNPVNAESPSRVKRRKEAEDLYARLTALDEQFEKDVQALFADARQKASHRQSDAQHEYEDRLDEAMQAAIGVANTSLNASASQLESKLSNWTERPRLSVPGTTVTLPISDTQTAPEPPPRATINASAVAQRSIGHDLKIWLALKGYRLAQVDEPSRDATQEFLEWKRTHHPGP